MIIIFNLNFSQTFNEREIRKLEKLGVINANTSNTENNVQLEKIITVDQYRKANKIWGCAFAGLGALAVAKGIIVMKQNKSDTEGLGQTVGIMSLVAGGLSFGGSALFFIRSGKEKKEIDELVTLYNNQY
jgi:hypothetical protein